MAGHDDGETWRDIPGRSRSMKRAATGSSVFFPPHRRCALCECASTQRRAKRRWCDESRVLCRSQGARGVSRVDRGRQYHSRSEAPGRRAGLHPTSAVVRRLEATPGAAGLAWGISMRLSSTLSRAALARFSRAISRTGARSIANRGAAPPGS
jgi:hypothetical protein